MSHPVHLIVAFGNDDELNVYSNILQFNRIVMSKKNLLEKISNCNITEPIDVKFISG